MMDQSKTLRLCCVLLVGFGATLATAADDSMLLVGKELFEREWTHDSESLAGDGLGPMFNDSSCLHCHHQGGSGGGGPTGDNVHVLSIESLSFRMPGANLRQDASQAIQLIREVHPALVDSAGGIQPILVLHRNATNPAYEVFRNQLLSELKKQAETAVPERPESISRRATPKFSISRKVESDDGQRTGKLDITFRVGQRNTTALYGAGLIDSVSDDTLRKLVKRQEQNPEISGRMAQVDGIKGNAGKFGWRGQVSTLRDFVVRACATELGLQTPSTDQPMDPLNVSYKPGGNDVSDYDVDAMTAFVAAMPAPVIRQPENSEARKIVRTGHQLFIKIGCAECHVKDLDAAQDIYSDLLLHDLGSELIDYAPATMHVKKEQLVKIGRRGGAGVNTGPAGLSLSQSGGSYYGPPDSFVLTNGEYPPQVTFQPKRVGATISRTLEIRREVEPTRIRNEWRTAPLWGLKDSAPYMHDGRARTVLEAIIMHGGESEMTTNRFALLSPIEQQALLAFLDTFEAPRTVDFESLASNY